jgi:ketosteroid isomerase-like protein
MAPQRTPEGISTTLEYRNRLLARRFWLATAEGDPETILGMFSPNIVWRTYGDNPMAGEQHGPEKVLDYMARLGETVEELHSNLDDIFVSGRGAVIHYHVSARRGPKRLDNAYLMILSIEAERILEVTVVPTDQRRGDAFWRLE